MTDSLPPALPLDARPLIVAIAGPNGAGKSTFYDAHVARAGLRFINADNLARELGIGAYEAAQLAEAFRANLVTQRESFAFETVLSDPIGEKVETLRQAHLAGYNVVLCFIGIDSPDTSEQRVGMRVSQGGHNVPTHKLHERYPRTMANLTRAIAALPFVWIYDNSDLSAPYRVVGVYQSGQSVFDGDQNRRPRWFTGSAQQPRSKR